MIDLVLSNQLLTKILKEDVSFKKGLRELFPQAKEESSIKNVSALVGCELRHHFLFKHLLRKCEGLSDELLYYVYLALANKFFIKTLDVNEVKAFMDEKFGDINHAIFDEIYAFEGSPIDLVKLPRDSVDFTSIRFNTPRWLVKMWSKHFGMGQTYKILKKNVRPMNQFVSVNSLKVNEEELLKSYPAAFKKTKINGLLEVTPKYNIKKLDEYKQDYFFNLKAPLKEIANKYHNELLDEISVYSGMNNDFIHELMVLSKFKAGINLVVPSIEKRAELLRLIRISKARNINLFEAHDEIGMKTGISGKQELFYVFPESSSFDLISKYPDYIVRFNRESLDGLIEGEKKALELVAPYIMEDGLLIYIVDTLNKKESTLIIEAFLEAHKEFELIEERQYFPYEEEEMALYKAVLKRKHD